MDSWASDGFYSHFPSYTQQPNRREALAKARQLDYQTYLSRKSPQKNNVSKFGKLRQPANDGQSKKLIKPTSTSANNNNNNDELMPKLDMHIVDENNSNNNNIDSSKSVKYAANSGLLTERERERNEFVNGLEKKDLPDIFNGDRVDERNERIAAEKRMRTIQYKQELMAQIEQKQRERELQRLKDEEEEERLTKRMEQQLKSVRLQDDSEGERQPRSREHHLINIEFNKPIFSTHHKKSPPAPTQVRSERFESNAYRAYDERKARSDHGKENCETVKRSDKEIYNFFTNSARIQMKDIRHSHYFDLDDTSENEAPSMSSSSYNTYPSKSSNRHRQAMCHFCKYNRFLTRNQEENLNTEFMCDACKNDPICLTCRKEMCVRCKRLKHNDENSTKQPFQMKQQQNYDSEILSEQHTNPIDNPAKSVRSYLPPVYTEKLSQQMQTDEDEILSDQSSTTEHKPPYSFNIDKSSVFHPIKSQANRRRSVSIRNGDVHNKPDSFDELKRITEEKLSKLTKRYIETTKANKTIDSGEMSTHLLNDNLMTDHERGYQTFLNSMKQNSIRVPTMGENTKRLIEFAKELERTDSNLYGRDGRNERIEQNKPAKSDAHKKTIIEYGDANTSTLIRIGAITKEMQSDRLHH